MNEKEISKNIESYSGYYKSLLSNEEINNSDQKMTLYKKRLKDMYSSGEFKTHNIYPSTNVAFVYAINVKRVIENLMDNNSMNHRIDI